MIVEIYKPLLFGAFRGNVAAALREGYGIEWTPDRIKAAFNFGRGTAADLKRYMNDNKNLCVFVEVQK